MSGHEQRKIDEIFRQSLGSHELPFEEEHWLNMQDRLGKTSRRKYFYKGLALGGAAAVLLLALGVWILQPVLVTEPLEIVRSPAGKAPATVKSAEPLFTVVPASGKNKKAGQTNNKPVDNLEKGAKRFALLGTPDEITINQPNQEATLLADPDLGHTVVERTQILFAGLSAPAEDIQQIIGLTAEAPVHDVPFHRSLSLGIMASPDFNSVNDFKNSKSAFSGGLTATFAISPAISFTTGLLLAHKVYAADYKYYKPAGSFYRSANATNVDASCNVLDIPLNMNYSLLSNGSSSLLVSAGASSYIMLTEDYKINSIGMKGPYNYHLSNQNQHYFGVANLGITYQKKITGTTSISVQPYAKVPITDIGYGHVRLYSSGISGSLNMNVSPRKLTVRKP